MKLITNPVKRVEKGEFKENFTISDDGKHKYSYYEKALDREGNWLKIGDWVRIIDKDPTQKDLVGLRRQITGIFEGDLMLQNEFSYDYCWPRNVVKTK